jgi:hypothetical protein
MLERLVAAGTGFDASLWHHRIDSHRMLHSANVMAR